MTSSAEKVDSKPPNWAKPILTEGDFETMNWHDVRIYAVALLPYSFELMFDVDYIIGWIHREQSDHRCKFWVAPATLVFENVYDTKFDLATYDGHLSIDSINRESQGSPRNAAYTRNTTEWLWTLGCHEGEITFRAAGYKLFVRENPRLSESSRGETPQRTISFARDAISNYSEEMICFLTNRPSDSVPSAHIHEPNAEDPRPAKPWEIPGGEIKHP